MPVRATTLTEVKRSTATPMPDNRPNSNQRGYNARWRKARMMFLLKNPLCVCIDCVAASRTLAATVVDHIIPHKGDKTLFWDQSNWQPMSKQCHDRKTATEDGGFGHKIKETA